jgi:hypothetical protein
LGDNREPDVVMCATARCGSTDREVGLLAGALEQVDVERGQLVPRLGAAGRDRQKIRADLRRRGVADGLAARRLLQHGVRIRAAEAE